MAKIKARLPHWILTTLTLTSSSYPCSWFDRAGRLLCKTLCPARPRNSWFGWPGVSPPPVAVAPTYPPQFSKPPLHPAGFQARWHIVRGTKATGPHWQGWTPSTMALRLRLPFPEAVRQHMMARWPLCIYVSVCGNIVTGTIYSTLGWRWWGMVASSCHHQLCILDGHNTWQHPRKLSLSSRKGLQPQRTSHSRPADWVGLYKLSSLLHPKPAACNPTFLLHP